jgi:hypothetical protein
LISRLAAAVPWWAAVFVLALGMRLGFVLLADEPMLYSHPYNYFNGGLSIVENADPWEFVLKSDAWHLWMGPWTIAPGYYLFVAAVFGTFGPHLLPLLVLQGLLDAGTAVMVGMMGRALAGPRGRWAGVAYAVNWHAVEQPASTLTENLHTVLLVAGITVLIEEARRNADAGEWTWRTVLGGFLLGFSGLARSVSTAFVPLAAAWRTGLHPRRRAALVAGVALAVGGALAVVPWTTRNVFLIGDFVPVESISVYNLWDDNAFVEGERRRQQEARIAAEPTLAGQRAVALRLTWRGISRNPGLFVEKAWGQLWHFLRPDGLQLLLVLEHPQPAWRHAVLVLLDDLLLVPTVVLFLVFAAAGHPSRPRALILLWTAYYLLMVVVLFHNEIRYRSTLMPFAFAGAAGGAAVLADPLRRRSWPARAGLALGLVAAARMLWPYAAPAWQALRAVPGTRAAVAAVNRGDLVSAEEAVRRASALGGSTARPWLRYGSALARRGHAREALVAYQRGQERKGHQWTPRLVRPALLRAAGLEAESRAAAAEADEFSWHVDPWQALEVAWRELPAPHTNEVLLGRNDYGAVRGFAHLARDHRWSRHRVWIRLQPTVKAPSYDVTLEMGSPEPSPHASPRVSVRLDGGAPNELILERAIKPYVLRAPAPPSGVVLIELQAPTWNKVGFPADTGIRIDRVQVTPIPF